VIVANTGGRLHTIRGSIAPSFTSGEFCGITLHRAPGSSHNVVKKIARRTAEPSWLVYWESADGVMKSKQCDDISVQLTIKEQFTNWTYNLSANELRDVVFAEPSY